MIEDLKNENNALSRNRFNLYRFVESPFFRDEGNQLGPKRRLG
ncbi:hypothetical protein LEP1GSC021_5063 [Leptospira noguchii str. 1993005606]|nr:hypothetical protein LEP1GSC021_5063 [Leptospira noguchii str. 1993005606]